MKTSFLRHAFILFFISLFFVSPALTYAADFTSENAGNSTYIVQKGDTLYSLGKRFGVKVDALRAANSMSADDVLKVGQKIVIPGNDSSLNSAVDKSNTRSFDTYTVQKGDTFWGIAKKNAITVDELKKINGLTDSTTLKTGQKLKIPATIIDTKNAKLPDLQASDPRNYSEKKGDSSLTWPVKNPSVTYIKGKVSGVQLSASANEEVTAIRAGTVMYCGNYRGYGQVVFVQSKTGHIYAYCGLGSIKVSKGQYLVFGDVIGSAGRDTIKNTSQITLMVFQKSSPIDPAKAPRG